MKANQSANYRLTRLALALAFLSTLLSLPAAQPAALAQAGSTPAAPQSELEGLEFVSQFGGAIYQSTIVGTTLYLSAGNHLAIMDVSIPTTPTILGQSAESCGQAGGIAISGNYAFVGVEGIGIAVIDIVNPTNPTRVSGYNSLIDYSDQITCTAATPTWPLATPGCSSWISATRCRSPKPPFIPPPLT